MATIELSVKEKEALLASIMNDNAVIATAIRKRIIELKKELDRYESYLESLGEPLEINVLEGDISSKVVEEIHKQEEEGLPKTNWKLHAISILKSVDRISTTNDIYDEFIKIKKEFSTYSKTKVIAKLSAALTKLHKLGNVKKTDNKLGRGNFWGMNSWYDGNEIKIEYKRELLNRLGVEEETQLLGDT